MTYNDNFLTISVEEADLQNMLLKLADETNIVIKFPVSLKNKISHTEKGIYFRVINFQK
jgi:hypothetical protein